MSQLSSSTNTHIFRSLSSESQKKDWTKRLSLRGIRHGASSGNSSSSGKDDIKKHKFFNRSSSLKQSTNTTAQPSLDLAGTGPGGSTLSQSSSQQPSTPKKSNWEVIEHFNTNAKGGKAVVSSSLIAAGITRCNVDESIDSTNSSSTCQSPMANQRDEAHLLQQNYDSSEAGRNVEGNANTNANLSPTISFWFRLNRIILRLCSTHQFKNLQVEMLYQRYFLRMNQSNTTHILVLLLGLILALSSAHVVFTTMQLKRNFSTTLQHDEIVNNGNKAIIMPTTQLLLPERKFEERGEQQQQQQHNTTNTNKILTSALQRNVEIVYQLPPKYKATVANNKNHNSKQIESIAKTTNIHPYAAYKIISAPAAAGVHNEIEDAVYQESVDGLEVIDSQEPKSLTQFLTRAKVVNSLPNQQQNLQHQFNLGKESKAALASRLFKRRKRKYLNRHLLKHRSRLKRDVFKKKKHMTSTTEASHHQATFKKTLEKYQQQHHFQHPPYHSISQANHEFLHKNTEKDLAPENYYPQENNLNKQQQQQNLDYNDFITSKYNKKYITQRQQQKQVNAATSLEQLYEMSSEIYIDANSKEEEQLKSTKAKSNRNSYVVTGVQHEENDLNNKSEDEELTPPNVNFTKGRQQQQQWPQKKRKKKNILNINSHDVETATSARHTQANINQQNHQAHLQHHDTLTYGSNSNSNSNINHYIIANVGQNLASEQSNNSKESQTTYGQNILTTKTFDTDAQNNDSVISRLQSSEEVEGESESESEPLPAAEQEKVNVVSQVIWILAAFQGIDDKTIVLLIVMTICVCVYAFLLCILAKPAMNEIFLVLVSYVIVGTFVAIQIAVGYATLPR